MGEDTTKNDAAMVWAFVENMLLVVSGSNDPSDLEFANYQKFCLEKWPQTSGYCMVVTAEGSLNAKQRDWVNKFLKSRTILPKVAIITDSTMVRGIVTALSWFNAGTKAFSPAKINDALSYLDVPIGARASKIVLEMRKLQASLAPPKAGKTGSK